MVQTTAEHSYLQTGSICNGMHYNNLQPFSKRDTVGGQDHRLHQVGACGGQRVFLGFAPAHVLHFHSFPDILDEDTGAGYQRPRNIDHSRDFCRYIEKPGASTIPLAFNLRKDLQKEWSVKSAEAPDGAILRIRKGAKCLAQVDCQHRIGELGEADISLAFMTFIGLTVREEMALFNIINSKARGLCSSLIDYHASNLLHDLAKEAPHLYLARKLNEDRDSPWFRMIRYGGESTSGLKRRTSLRMMQKSIQKLISNCSTFRSSDIDTQYAIIRLYWTAVKDVFSNEWEDHRHHLLTKGVGLYALTMLLGHILNEAHQMYKSESDFVGMLSCLQGNVDWHSNGTFSDVGGQKGATEAFKHLRGLLK